MLQAVTNVYMYIHVYRLLRRVSQEWRKVGVGGAAFHHARNDVNRCSGQVLGDPLGQDSSRRRGDGARSRSPRTWSPPLTFNPLMLSSWKGSAAEWPLRASLRPTIPSRTRKRPARGRAPSLTSSRRMRSFFPTLWDRCSRIHSRRLLERLLPVSVA